MYLRKTILTAVLTIAVVSAFAAPAPKKTLTQANLDIFISSLSAVMDDLDSVDLEGEKGIQAAMDSAFQGENFNSASMLGGFAELKKYDMINTILRKNGWGPTFWDVYVAVLGGYFVCMIDTMIAQSPEYKEMAKNPSYVEFQSLVHKDDIALVRKNFERVGIAFDSVDSE